MGNFPELKSGKILLRKPEKEDIYTRILFGTSSEFVKMCGGDTNNINGFTLDDGIQWYKKIIDHPCKWVIEYDGTCIGEVALTPYKQDNKARYSIAIFDMSKWGLGIGTIVAKIVLNYAFNRMKYHKVYLRVLEYNKRAISCYENADLFKRVLTEKVHLLVETMKLIFI